MVMRVMVNLMLKDKMWHWDWVGCQQHFYGWYNMGTFPAPRRHCVMYMEHSWILSMTWTYFISSLTWSLCNASYRKPTYIHSNNSCVTPFTFRGKIRKGKDVQHSYRQTVVFTIRPFTAQATVTIWAITVFYITSAITDSSILTYQIHTVLTATPCNNKNTGWRIKLLILL